MKLVSSAQMRELDRRTIEEFGVPGAVLMERAGLGVARAVRAWVEAGPAPRPVVHVFAGRGNNGGDAFVAARCLKEWGFAVEVRLAGRAEDLRGDPIEMIRRMRTADVACEEAPAEGDWEGLVVPGSGEALVVDGLLGTGAKGAPRGVIAAAIRRINAIGRHNRVVAIDLPSGLDADSGDAPGEAVRADATVTMGLPKTGLVAPGAADYVGNLEVVDIGLPPALVEALPSGPELIAAAELRALMPRRPRAAHKGAYGHVLVIGGAPGYAGAAALAARAALRSGAGLVSVLTPRGIAPIVAGLVPEAMVHAGAENITGSLAADALAAWNRELDAFDAVVIGPGMTPQADSRLLTQEVLAHPRLVRVVDADALNACRGDLTPFRTAQGGLIVTPHPGEMGRLLGCTAAEVQAARFETAARAVERLGCVVVLKGAGTLVAAPGRAVQVNVTGNPGMAKGGMGDALAGLTAGLAAQGLDPYDAARLAVFAHGRAGDLAAQALSEPGMTVDELIDRLPLALRELSGR